MDQVIQPTLLIALFDIALGIVSTQFARLWLGWNYSFNNMRKFGLNRPMQVIELAHVEKFILQSNWTKCQLHYSTSTVHKVMNDYWWCKLEKGHISVQVASLLIWLTRHWHICPHLYTTRELMMPSADWIHGQNMQDLGRVMQESQSDDFLAISPALRILQLNVEDLSVAKCSVIRNSREA